MAGRGKVCQVPSPPPPPGASRPRASSTGGAGGNATGGPEQSGTGRSVNLNNAHGNVLRFQLPSLRPYRRNTARFMSPLGLRIQHAFPHAAIAGLSSITYATVERW